MSYITLPSKHRIESFRRALTVGLGAQLLAAPVLMAQDAAQPASSSEPLEMERVVITGSLIPTAETVTTTPVEVFNAVQIESVGATDTLTTLQRLSPYFTGNGNVGKSVNNGGGGESYIALRNLTTLVLLNGKRLAGSAFQQGSIVDLNTIPISMVERIEVLKDGASVLYGSQAVGGVVNIITKKNYSGAEVGGMWGFATEKGSYKEHMEYASVGSSTDKATFTAGIQQYHSDPLLTKDREIPSLGIAGLISRNVNLPTYVSPSYPGKVQDPGTSYILAGSEFAVGAEGYRPGLTKPPVFPGHSFTSVAAYNAYAQEQLGYSPYIRIKDTPIGQALNAALEPVFGPDQGEGAAWPLLNTTLLNTHSLQSQSRVNAFADASYEIYGKRMQLYGSFLYSNTSADGQLAPSPVPSLTGTGINVSASDPNNPFQTDLGAGAASNPRVRSRFVESGNRVFENQNNYYQFVGGLKGEFENDYTYNAYYNYNENDQTQYSRGGINGILLQQAFTPNANPYLAEQGLSALTDASGNAVPLYNIFALSGNDPRTIDVLNATGFQSGVSTLGNAEGQVTGRPFELPGGKIGFAVGGGYMNESLSIDYDGLTRANNLVGYTAANPTPGGNRENWYAYAEVNVPITGPQMEIPVLHSLEITAAGRYETFDPGGDKAVPKVGIRWQPLDEQFTLRGNWSESFVAPTVFQLYGAPLTSADTVSLPEGTGQVDMSWTSSPNLTPATADNWTAGIVITPKAVKGLTLTFDYYKVSTEDDVFRVGAQAVANSLNELGSASPYAPGFTFIDGRKLTTTAPNQIQSVNQWLIGERPYANGAKQETDGFDVSATYLLPTDNWGQFSFSCAANVLLEYTYYDPAILGPYNYEKQFTDNGPAGGAQGTLPGFKLVPSLAWEFKNFTYTINAQYIPSVMDLGSQHPSNDPANPNIYTIDGSTWSVPAWYSIDMQLAYKFASKAGDEWYDGIRLAVGCNNITNKGVPIDPSSSEDNTDKATYDLLGRFVYFQMAKKF
ncbi:MAG TPA: TonB-dependent receptor plug domain-containing protein [Verrucomicrobiota bacterium]|nr:hypothetical protein [Verrucomicrobiales bacterium]HRI15118.1 TonB-dependent receptor plug domain-containing protein [Verrucomicrobiota bacterium]